MTPFALSFIYNFVVLGRESFDDLTNESMHLTQGLAILWLLGHWVYLEELMPWFPGIPILEASTLFYELAGLSLASTKDFWRFTLMLSIAVVTACGLWTAVLAARLKLRVLAIVMMSSLLVLQPVILALPLNAYFYFGVILLPIGIGLCALAEPDSFDRPAVLMTLPLMGLASSIHYTGLVVIAAFIVSWFVFLARSPSYRRSFVRTVNSWGALWKILSVLATAVFVASLVMTTATLIRQRAGVGPTPEKIILLASLASSLLIGGLVLAWAIFRHDVVRAFLIFCGLISVGWALGSNVFAFDYFKPGIEIFTSRVVEVSSEEGYGFSLTRFLEFRFWNYWIVLALAVSGALLLHALWSSSDASSRDLFLGLFALLVVLGLLGLSYHSMFVMPIPATTALNFSDHRYVVGIAVTMPMAFLWIAGRSLRVRGVFYVAVTAIVLLSFGDFYRIAVPHMAAVNRFSEASEVEIARFARAYPGGLVLCGVRQQRSCGHMVARLWYERRLAAYHRDVGRLPENIFDPRLVWGWFMPSMPCHSLDQCLAHYAREGVPLLVLESQADPSNFNDKGRVLYDADGFLAWIHEPR